MANPFMEYNSHNKPADDYLYMNRGVINIGQSYPFSEQKTQSIPANASQAEYVLWTIPQGEAWLISNVGITASNSTVYFRIDGYQLANAVNGTVERNLKTIYGDFILATKNVSIVANNTGASAANQAITLYGWKVTL